MQSCLRRQDRNAIGEDNRSILFFVPACGSSNYAPKGQVLIGQVVFGSV